MLSGPSSIVNTSRADQRVLGESRLVSILWLRLYLHSVINETTAKSDTIFQQTFAALGEVVNGRIILAGAIHDIVRIMNEWRFRNLRCIRRLIFMGSLRATRCTGRTCATRLGSLVMKMCNAGTLRCRRLITNYLLARWVDRRFHCRILGTYMVAAIPNPLTILASHIQDRCRCLLTVLSHNPVQIA